MNLFIPGIRYKKPGFKSTNAKNEEQPSTSYIFSRTSIAQATHIRTVRIRTVQCTLVENHIYTYSTNTHRTVYTGKESILSNIVFGRFLLINN